MVEGGLAGLAKGSMPELWLLALLMGCVVGEAEGVCMPISFSLWSCRWVGQNYR